MTYMEAWKMMAPHLPIDTDEQRDAYLQLYLAVKSCEAREQNGKVGKADQEQ